MLKIRGASSIVLLLLFLLGCGDGTNRREVSGVVTYDGQPVETGQISLVPADGSGAAEGGVITDGEFTFLATPGSKKVEIRGSRPVANERQTNTEMGLMYEDYIPAVYNRETKLSAEVTVEGDGRLEFHLEAP